MKSRFLFAPIPILIATVLLGLDAWTGDNWGVYFLIAAISSACMFEVGMAYSHQLQELPVYPLTAGMVLLMLVSGLSLLFPSGKGIGVRPIVSFSLPFLVVVLVILLYWTATYPPERVPALLTGLGLFALFSITYFHAYILLRELAGAPRLSTAVVVFLLVVSKGADSGAYLVGTFFGSRKMTPRLSPNKTWVGLFGGLITGSMLGSCFVFTEIGQHLSAGVLAVISCVIALSATGGDLIGSLLKRGADVEDSSTLLPGLGGILDMTDSFLVSVPVALLILLLIS